jgi:lauroyl/myristoyl acyltransferase
MLPALQVRGAEHLRAVQGGAIVNFLHHGPFESFTPSFGEAGLPLHTMVDPRLLAADARPWERQILIAGTRGGMPFSAAEGSRGIRDRLEAGGRVALASDVPGSTPVEFVGRRVLGSFGAARMAFETGSPVLVLTARQGAEGAYFELTAPMRPQDFDGPETLLKAMLRVHEPSVLAWPEAYQEPLTKWRVPEPADDDGPGTPRP